MFLIKKLKNKSQKSSTDQSLSPFIEYILETDINEIRFKNVLITKFLFRFPNEIILELLSFVPDFYLVLFFLINISKIRFLEDELFIPGTRIIYIDWFPNNLDETRLNFKIFEELIISKKINIRFLEIFQFSCIELNKDDWQIPLFLFPFIVRYKNQNKTKADIDDWNRIPKLNDSQENFLLNQYSIIIKEYKRKIHNFSKCQDDAQQDFFKRIKNTNFQFTIKSMEQNSCFKNYQFSRLHLKTYYLYRGSRSLNNLFNFKKLTKLTIDFLYPGYRIPNWKKIVSKLVALKYFTLNIGKLHSDDIQLILQIKTLVEFNFKTYFNWRVEYWKKIVDTHRAKLGKDCPKISMKFVNPP